MNPKLLFRANIRRARKAVYFYDRLRQKGKTHKSVADLLRMSLVMSLSSLDAYVHELISENLVDFIKKNLQATNRFPKLTNIEKLSGELLSPLDYLQMFGRDRPYVQFKKKIERALLQKTYQSPEGIENALRLFGVVHFWKDLEQNSKSTLKREAARLLRSFYNRRNQIAHEMDREHSRKKKHKERNINRETCVECQKLVIVIVDYIEKTYLDSTKPDFILK